MSDQPFSFDEPLEWRLAGTPEMAGRVLVAFGRYATYGDRGYTVRLNESAQGELQVRIHIGGPGGGTIADIELHELPGEQRSLLRIPVHGGLEEHAWGPADIEWLNGFMGPALDELQRLGFLATSSRFDSHSILDTAARELGAAEESEAIAAVANIIRSAMLELADELYAEHMLADGAEAPKKDDAKGKLGLVINHYFAGRSENYRKGLIRSADGAWMAVSALVHRRKRAKREEAEICLALMKAQFEMFSLMVPEG